MDSRGQENIATIQVGEASKPLSEPSNLTTSHLGPESDRLQNGHRSAGHSRLHSTHDPSSAQSSKRPPGHSVFSKLLALPVGRSRKKTVDCLICLDTFEAGACFHAPCDHYYCHECTVGMAKAAVAEGNENLFPIRCCNKPFPDKLLKSLPEPLRKSVTEKAKEMSIPGPQRLYCPNGTCSAFLGKAPGGKEAVTCPQCHAEVCPACKRLSHSPKPCGPLADDLMREARGYAADKGWRVCPGCAVIVERTDGCPEMSCRCGVVFCYDCGMARPCRCQSG
ncbi:hypothetical protein OG21DRAFT_1448392 [Imleria badia]|nr:hypothetical protein OG21DRAFT_1448392 [Imleria badia]